MRRFENPLDSIKIASPCPANWDAMIGDERKRFCDQCSRNVFNLSGMTRDEAKQFLFEVEGRVCARFYRRSDGTIITKDCPIGLRSVRDRIKTTGLAFTSVIATFVAGVFSVRAVESIIDRIPIGDVPAPPYLERTTTGFADDFPEVGEVEVLLGEVDYSTGQIREDSKRPR